MSKMLKMEFFDKKVIRTTKYKVFYLSKNIFTGGKFFSNRNQYFKILKVVSIIKHNTSEYV